MTSAPILYTWTDDGTMRPLPRFAARCDAEFVVGEQYRLDAVEERSQRSHSHFFATLRDIWLSLPDAVAVQFPTVETLRRHALIMTGWRRERKFAASSAAEARKLAAFLRPDTLDDDHYAIISVNGPVVVEWRALSQSRRAMPRKGDFQKSKDDVLAWASDLLAPARKREAA